VDIVEIDSAIAATEREMIEWADRNPTCPVCGGPVDPEKLLTTEHTHV
jgi:hypothetical protein